MGKSEWSDIEIVIRNEGKPDSECVVIPILGKKQTNLQIIMTDAFNNAVNLILDAEKITQYSRIILCSLACELFLKAIIMKTQNRQSRGHDIYKLYYELEEKEQNDLLDAYITANIQQDNEITADDIDVQVNDFEKDLMLNALLFKIIRYKHEYSTIAYNGRFIYNFAHNLKLLCTDLGLHR